MLTSSPVIEPILSIEVIDEGDAEDLPDVRFSWAIIGIEADKLSFAIEF